MKGKLGTEDRGDGKERKTVGEEEVNLKISNAISLFANVPSISGFLSIPIPDSRPRPQSFHHARTFKEQNPPKIF